MFADSTMELYEFLNPFWFPRTWDRSLKYDRACESSWDLNLSLLFVKLQRKTLSTRFWFLIFSFVLLLLLAMLRQEISTLHFYNRLYNFRNWCCQFLFLSWKNNFGSINSRFSLIRCLLDQMFIEEQIYERSLWIVYVFWNKTPLWPWNLLVKWQWSVNRWLCYDDFLLLLSLFWRLIFQIMMV